MSNDGLHALLSVGRFCILGSRIKDVRTTSSFGFAEGFVAATFRESKISPAEGQERLYFRMQKPSPGLPQTCNQNKKKQITPKLESSQFVEVEAWNHSSLPENGLDLGNNLRTIW